MEETEQTNIPFKRKVHFDELHVCEELINNNARISLGFIRFNNKNTQIPMWLIETKPQRRFVRSGGNRMKELEYEAWKEFERCAHAREREMQAFNFVLDIIMYLLNVKDFCVNLYNKLRRNYGKNE